MIKERDDAMHACFGSGIKLVKPNFKVLLAIGGPLGILFEVIFGGWLLFYSHI